jgi:hypothetical protein
MTWFQPIGLLLVIRVSDIDAEAMEDTKIKNSITDTDIAATECIRLIVFTYSHPIIRLKNVYNEYFRNNKTFQNVISLQKLSIYLSFYQRNKRWIEFARKADEEGRYVTHKKLKNN